MLFFSQPSAENFRCQKCLKVGHWTYQCTGKRKYTSRDSRTKELDKELNSEGKKALVKTTNTRENVLGAKKSLKK